MDGVILKSGGASGSENVTARPEHVRKGKLFKGAGTKEIQTGIAEDLTAIRKQMSVNETYKIPPGIHDGTDYFYQDEVEKIDGPVIEPGAGGQTINVTGKYLITDSVIMDVDNLRPDVIKYGISIGDVTGTYQGFPDEG